MACAAASLSGRALARLAANAPVASRRWLHASSGACKPFVVTVPQMAESISEGTVAQVLKAPGQGECLCCMLACVGARGSAGRCGSRVCVLWKGVPATQPRDHAGGWLSLHRR